MPNILFLDVKLSNIVVLCVHLIFSFISFKNLNLKPVLLVYFFIFLLILNVHSISIVFNSSSGFVDILDIFRNFSFFFFFLLGYSIDRSLFIKYFGSYLKIILIILLISTFLSFLFRDSFDNLELYYGKIDNAVSGRNFFPFYNPYDLGLFLLIPFIYFFLGKNYFLFLLSYMLIFSTQSRTAIILSLIFVLFSFVIFKNSRKIVFSLLIFISLILGGIFYYFDTNILESFYLYDNSIKLLSGESTTLTKRYDQWENLISMDLFGSGVIHTNVQMVENGFLYEIIKFGVFSIITLLFYYTLPVFNSILFLLKNKLFNNRVNFTFAFWIVLFVIGSAMNVFLYQVKLSFVFWFVNGFLLKNFKC
jgi:hypothetical protein